MIYINVVSGNKIWSMILLVYSWYCFISVIESVTVITMILKLGLVGKLKCNLVIFGVLGLDICKSGQLPAAINYYYLSQFFWGR